jgi:hypothetical protein
MPSRLDELDRIKADLQDRFPGWQIWYVPHSVDRSVTWCARPHPLLNEGSPEDLAAAIERQPWAPAPPIRPAAPAQLPTGKLPLL